MDFRVDTLGPCRKKVAVTIPTERVREEYDKQVGELNKSFVLPGFRKGHAPKKLLERRFGPHLGDDVKERLVKAALEALITEKKVEPLRPPSLDLAAMQVDPGKPLAFEFELLTRPEFATPAWKGLEMKVAPVTASADEVARGVESLRRRGATLSDASDAVIGDGDVLVVDWAARAGDEVLARDQGAYYPFGRGALAGFPAEEIDAQLRGKKAGARAETKVKAGDDDPREALRGKDLLLAVTVKDVKRYVLPAVDAEFLKKNDYDDEAEMRADLERQILRGKTRERDRAAEDKLVEGLVAGVAMTLPEEILGQELEGWAERKKAELREEGVVEDALDKKVAEARPEAKKTIEAELKRFFVLDRIAREENLAVADAEVGQALQEIAQAYGRPIEEVLEAYRASGRIEELRSSIRHKKVREAVRRAAHVVQTSGKGDK
jgi:trigger factor